MKNKETKTTRISEWVYRLFTDKANIEDTSFIKKIDEIAESLQLLNINEVVLDNFLQNAYKEDETNTPRCVFEALSALMNYWDSLNGNEFNKYNFKQFIDRWNIVAYYISTHIYTNVLSKSALTNKELCQRAESASALAFLFDKNANEVIECTKEICKELDPYENAYISLKSKALILSKIFEHEKLMEYIESENIIRKESAIADLFKKLSKKYNLKAEGETFYELTNIKSTGLTNKIAYLIYKNHKKGIESELPYFVNEEFIADIFYLLHNCYLKDYSSDLYYAKPLESAFLITRAIMLTNGYESFDDSYLKGNLQNSNNYNNLIDALEADTNCLGQTLYTYSPEMRMRTPMHIVRATSEKGIKFVQRLDIKNTITENLVNLLYPLYRQIVNIDGEILYFRDSNHKITEYSEDESAQISVNMKDKDYYTNLILYVRNGKSILSTITIYMKHDSLEKIYYKLLKEDYDTTKIEKDLTFYYDSKDTIKINYKQGSLLLHGTIKDSLVDVITKYVTSDKFIENKKFDMLNNGII